MASMSSPLHRDHRPYVLICSLVWIYLALRAALVPWVHDESTSLFWYVERGEFLPYAALWDAGNHFLSSGIGILSYKLWGLSLIGSRAGSLLAFPIYAWAAYRIGAQLQTSAVRWACWSALIMCPFLLDFFSLFRGYGLGMAFWLVAIDGGSRYRVTHHAGDLSQLLIGLFLADMAVLSLIPLWALIVTAAGMHLAWQWKTNAPQWAWRKGAIWVVLGVIPLLFGLLLAWEMKRRGLLYHGSTEGFIPVTLASLADYVLGTRHVVVLLSIILTLAIATLTIPMLKLGRSLLALLATVLWADVSMRIAMAYILDVNFPEDRAALHLIPVAILVVAFAADRRSARRNLISTIFILVLLVLPIRTLYTANLDHTSLWPEQSVPTHFVTTIAELQEQQERPLLIGVYHQLNFALPYAARVNGLQLNSPDAHRFPFTDHDIRIVDHRHIADATPGFTLLHRAGGSGLHLLLRDTPMPLAEVEWSDILTGPTGSEFQEIWVGEQAMENDLLLEVRCTISTDLDFVNMYLVVSQEFQDSSMYYHAIPLAHWRTRWWNDEFKCLVRVPALRADRRVVYFWNVDKEMIALENIRLGTYRQLPIADKPAPIPVGSTTFGSPAQNP